MGHILATMPFGMSVVIMTLNGSELRSMFEYSVSEYSFTKKQGRFLQVSALVGDRVLEHLLKLMATERHNDEGVSKRCGLQDVSQSDVYSGKSRKYR
ncbi:hypothetical protein HPB49_015946 [Dermacentor silvarum]|uniref:Uncharacterized protein n=1 Tax=Dermacentor silvarum TaxID=543639 RepID=A0ACB8DEE1_DERSI|nr:hypothetical protein HPB49_015946 [Dermacentor silvarum]